MIFSPIKKFVIGWIISAIALYAASYYLPDFNYDSVTVLAIVSGLFSVIALLLKPILKILSLPLFFLGPILFFVVDVAVLWGLGLFVPGFHTGDLLTVLIAGGIVGLVNYVAHWFVK